jgi:hypothetical protein
MLPNFVVIGAQKSGTTFVLKCLGEHPDVFMPPGETRFFEDPEYLQTDINQFEALFRDVSQKKAVGIKRPDYLAKPECPERIYKHIPEAKLIVILRNPVKRAISAYFYQMQQSFIPIRPIEEGMAKVINGEYRDSYPKSEEIVEYGFYHRHLLRYLNYFDRNQMLIMPFDDFIRNKRESIRKIYRFIGVNDEYMPESIRSRTNPGVYSLTRLRILTIRNPFMYAYNDERTKRYRKQDPQLLDRLINKMVIWTDRLLLAPICDNSKPALSANLTDRLFEIYKEDINRLEGFLGHNLTGWK